MYDRNGVRHRSKRYNSKGNDIVLRVKTRLVALEIFPIKNITSICGTSKIVESREKHVAAILS